MNLHDACFSNHIQTTNEDIQHIIKTLSNNQTQYVVYSHFKNEITSFELHQKPNTEEYEIIFSTHLMTFCCYCLGISYTFHNLSGPAIIQIGNKLNNVIYKCHYKNNKKHREDGPAVFFYSNQHIIEEVYFINNALHREDGPARISYSSCNRITKEEYDQNNKIHRLDGPAIITYYNDGCIETEHWFKNNKRHRLNGPAYTYYQRVGTSIKSWYLNNKTIDTKKYPIVENNRICGEIPLTKETILNALLFDREYGMFLKQLYDKLSSQTI